MKKKQRKPKHVLMREHRLRPMIREACRTGMVEAIEHCSNFWSVADGYKKYIDARITAESEALMAAVRAVLREPAVFEQRPRRKYRKRRKR